MLNFASNRRIFLARAPIDMRKGAGTLTALVEHGLEMDPYQGDIFLFVGRNRNRVKVLVWDHSGFWLCAKRLERGTFAIPADTVGATSWAPRRCPPPRSTCCSRASMSTTLPITSTTTARRRPSHESPAKIRVVYLRSIRTYVYHRHA